MINVVGKKILITNWTFLFLQADRQSKSVLSFVEYENITRMWHAVPPASKR